jgi:murein hydrolase activator
MRSAFLVATLSALLLGARPPAPIEVEPPPLTVEQAQAEFEAARKRSDTFQAAADRAAGSLQRLRADKRAALSALETSEARITLAELKLRAARARALAEQRRIAEVQRPLASLLTGIAILGQRPPLMTLVDRANADELVRTQLLMQSTLPVIRARTKDLDARRASAERAFGAARASLAELEAGRRSLEAERKTYAALEQRLLAEAARAGGAAVSASDLMLATGELRERLRAEAQGNVAIRAEAIALASGPAIPARPGSADGPMFRAPFPYRLPAAATLTQGLGEIDSAGVRSRGITLATPRGAPIEAPASGSVRFAGPFSGFDGVIIIDHGSGWMTMLVNLSPSVGSGQDLAIGAPVGRALGPVSVELYRNGKPYSPALIAGSSPPLSKGAKAR